MAEEEIFWGRKLEPVEKYKIAFIVFAVVKTFRKGSLQIVVFKSPFPNLNGYERSGPRECWDDLVEKKIDDTGKDQFNDIIAEVSHRFQDLGGIADKLRQILFPTCKKTLVTGTDLSSRGTNK